MAKIKIHIPVLVMNSGDGSCSVTALHTEQQRNRFIEQMDELNEDGSDSAMEDRDQFVDIEVDLATGIWNVVKEYPWQRTPEELIASRDEEITKQNEEE